MTERRSPVFPWNVHPSPPVEWGRYVQLERLMTKSLEFRFAIVGLVFGGLIALYILTARPQTLARIDVRGGHGGYAAPGPVQTGNLYPVYEPPSMARVAQFFLIDLDQPDKTVETLKAIPDAATRIIATQWLLDAPQREVPYSAPPEQAQYLSSQIGKILEPLLDLTTNTSFAITDVKNQDDFEVSQRSIDSMLRIARFLNHQGENKAADGAAEIARKEALRFAQLTPPEVLKAGYDPFSSMTTENVAGSEVKGTTGYRKATVLFWPLLLSAFCFSIAHAAKPVLEAIGKAFVGKAIADRFENADMARALGLVDSKNDGDT